jgi:hypothetical protein
LGRDVPSVDGQAELNSFLSSVALEPHGCERRNAIVTSHTGDIPVTLDTDYDRLVSGWRGMVCFRVSLLIYNLTQIKR